MQHAAICDHCDRFIFGVRFKCAQCVDYDLCAECEALHQQMVENRLAASAIQQYHHQALLIHDITHTFYKVRYPLAEMVATRPPMLLQALYECEQVMQVAWCQSHARAPSTATCGMYTKQASVSWRVWSADAAATGGCRSDNATSTCIHPVRWVRFANRWYTIRMVIQDTSSTNAAHDTDTCHWRRPMM
jgi:hypothetical protein